MLDVQIRDPFILKHDSRYYLYGSTDRDIWTAAGTGFDAYSGTDLENWEGPYAAFRPPEGFWGTRNFWAPEVHEYNGAFYMFATFIADGVNRGTAILRAEHPTGPFLPWSDGAVTPKDWMCLDGTLFVDEGGKPWIVFCHEWVQIGDGTICAAELSPDLKHTVSEPVTLFHSSDAPWSVKVTTRSNQTGGYVTDGCYLYKMKNGKLLMLWSCIGADGYCIGYSISDSGNILGPWRQLEKPLFAKDGGHGMIFETFDGQLTLTIHKPNKTPDERAIFLALKETDGGIELASKGDCE